MPLGGTERTRYFLAGSFAGDVPFTVFHEGRKCRVPRAMLELTLNRRRGNLYRFSLLREAAAFGAAFLLLIAREARMRDDSSAFVSLRAR